MSRKHYTLKTLVALGFLSSNLMGPVAVIAQTEAEEENVVENVGTEETAPDLVEEADSSDSLEEEPDETVDSTEIPEEEAEPESEEEPASDSTEIPPAEEDLPEETEAEPVEEAAVEEDEEAEPAEIVEEDVELFVEPNDDELSAAADSIPMQLLGINDFHGALDMTGSATFNGERLSDLGGAAYLATYLNDARDAFLGANPNARSMRLHSGDIVGASPANSGLLQDEPTMRVLHEMGFELGTLGNHEFDEGLAEFNRILEGSAPEAGVFPEYVENYNRTGMPDSEIVIANVVDKATGEVPFGWEPYTIEEFGDGEESVSVGFIGVVTTEVPNLVLRRHHEEYNILDEADTIVQYAEELREEGVEAIVVLSHVGATSADGTATGEMAAIMQEVDAADPDHSVDVVFAGHNHQYTNGVYDGQNHDTLIVQSTSNGRGYIDVQGALDPETDDFVAVPTAEVVPVHGSAVEADPAVQAIIDEANAIVEVVASQPIATAGEGDISREVNEHKESPLGNLLTDGQLWDARQSGYDVDFAFTNNGGIRADLEVAADGETITWGAAQAVQPFGNILQVVELTGQDIIDALNQQFSPPARYFLQVSGLTYTYTDRKLTAEELEAAGDEAEELSFQIHEVLLEDGTPLDPEATYTVVINDFLLGGGDGFGAFTNATNVQGLSIDTDTFINYLSSFEEAGETVTAQIEGRKTYVSAEDIADDEEEPAQPEQPTVPGETEDPADPADPEEPADPEVETPVEEEENRDGGLETDDEEQETEKKKGGVLPQTGSASSALIPFLGMALTGGGLTLLFKKKKR